MKHLSPFQTIKIPLASVVRSPSVTKKIDETAIRTSKIMSSALLFLKCYLLAKYDDFAHSDHSILPIIPKVDIKLARAALKTVSGGSNLARLTNPETRALMEDMGAFYDLNDGFHSLEKEQISRRHLTEAIEYMAVEVVTNYDNHIIANFKKQVFTFVNFHFGKNARLREIQEMEIPREEKRQLRNAFLSRLSIVKRQLTSRKQDVMFVDCQVGSPEYDALNQDCRFVHAYYKAILGDGAFRGPEDGEPSLPYDVKCEPRKYFPAMLYMAKVMELSGSIHIPRVFPLRRSIVPSFFQMDTTIVLNVLYDVLYEPDHNPLLGPKSTLKKGGNLVSKRLAIWNVIFDMNAAPFHLGNGLHNFTFSGSVQSDGVSLCILLIRKDLLEGERSKSGRRRVPDFEVPETQYLTSLTEREIASLRNKTIVGSDPGKSDLLFCVNQSGKDGQKQWRISQNERAKRLQSRKNRKLRRNLQNSTNVHDAETGEDKTISQLQSELAAHSSASLDPEVFKEYVRGKFKLNFLVGPFYSKKLWRKLRLGTYMSDQAWGASVVRSFRNTFGGPGAAILCVGDWSQQHTFRGQEPTKGKSLRRLFRRAGYQVYLIHEAYTSKRCSVCKDNGPEGRPYGSCAKFRTVSNPKPWRQDYIQRHGLLRCDHCHRLWNRDANGACNIWTLANEQVCGRPRPNFLSQAEAA